MPQRGMWPRDHKALRSPLERQSSRSSSNRRTRSPGSIFRIKRATSQKQAAHSSCDMRNSFSSSSLSGRSPREFPRCRPSWLSTAEHGAVPAC
jgi:hypothetical protein